MHGSRPPVPRLPPAGHHPHAPWDLIETRCDVDLVVDNRFDPDQIAVWGDLQAPDGSVSSVPGFWGRDFSRALTDAGEALTAVGDASWRVRFSAEAPGAWQWRWRLEAPGVSDSTPWQSIDISAGDSHGPLRVSAADPVQLAFFDTTPFVAVGENVAWADTRGTYAYDDWLAKLAAQRANFIRVWLPSWGFGIEWEQLGRYDDRLDRAWQLDQVLETVRASGAVAMLCMQEHGAFSTEFNSTWADNPYNKANGGPLETPQQFFAQPDARRLFKQRLRYLVARLSWAPQLMAWELFNEVDLTLEMDADVLSAWHEEMAQYLHTLDPHRHLVTTSLSGLLGDALGLDEPVFSPPDIDFTQLHLYGGASPVDFTQAVPAAVAALGKYGKPVLAAEVGVDSRSAADTLATDPDGRGFHELVWSALLSGSIGTGMSWWWDSVVDPSDLYPQLGPAAAFTQGLAFDVEHFRPCHDVSSSQRVLALCGATTALAWVKNPNDLYTEAIDDSVVSGVTLSLAPMPDGDYSAQWLDPQGGGAPAATTAHASGGTLTVAVPAFAHDLAVRLVAR